MYRFRFGAVRGVFGPGCANRSPLSHPAFALASFRPQFLLRRLLATGSKPDVFTTPSTPSKKSPATTQPVKLSLSGTRRANRRKSLPPESRRQLIQWLKRLNTSNVNTASNKADAESIPPFLRVSGGYVWERKVNLSRVSLALISFSRARNCFLRQLKS